MLSIRGEGKGNEGREGERELREEGFCVMAVGWMDAPGKYWK